MYIRNGRSATSWPYISTCLYIGTYTCLYTFIYAHISYLILECFRLSRNKCMNVRYNVVVPTHT